MFKLKIESQSIKLLNENVLITRVQQYKEKKQIKQKQSTKKEMKIEKSHSFEMLFIKPK